MKAAFLILTYNRSKVASLSLNTLFNNAGIRPAESWIFDDGSDEIMKRGLLDFTLKHSTQDSPINLSIHGKNYGVGYNFERLYSIMRQSEDIQVFCIAESDYIFRKFWYLDCEAVFKASPNTIAISAVSHPDMEIFQKTHVEFPKLMIDQFGKDLDSRQDLYKSFYLDTERGKIKVRGVSNACGSIILHWQRLQNILKEGDSIGDDCVFNTKNFWKWMNRAFHKNNTGNRRFASDAHLSGTLSFFSEEYMKYKGIDITKNFGFLDVEDWSLSEHLCAKGINGHLPGYEEGQTFVKSKSWDYKYLDVDPRA